MPPLRSTNRMRYFSALGQAVRVMQEVIYAHGELSDDDGGETGQDVALSSREFLFYGLMPV